MRNPLLLSSLALLSIVAVGLPAPADLDLAIRNRDRIRGTIFPADEVQTFRVTLPRGARLRAAARPKATRDRTFPPAVRLRLFDPIGRDISAEFASTRGKKARIAGFTAPETGTYAIELRGDGFDIGDYMFSVRWKSPRRVKAKNVAVGAEPVAGVVVPADVDSTLRIRAKTRKRSGVIPHVTDVVGPDDQVVRPFSVPNPPRPRHNVEATVRDSGEFDVRVADAAGVGGEVTLDVRVKRPAGGRRDVRLTDFEVGETPANVDLISTVLFDARGGATPGQDARVELPSGAVRRLTPVLVGLGEAFAGPAGTGLVPAGRPVFVGPESLEFDRLVDVVVPFDPAALPSGTGELRLVRRDAAGALTVLDTNSIVIDGTQFTASVPVSRGGTYCAFREIPPPSPTSITPFTGGVGGGYSITLGGTGFRDLRDPQTGESRIEVLLDGQVVDVEIVSVSATLVSFVAPPHTAGSVTFAVRDPDTGLSGSLPTNAFLYR